MDSICVFWEYLLEKFIERRQWWAYVGDFATSAIGVLWHFCRTRELYLPIDYSMSIRSSIAHRVSEVWCRQQSLVPNRFPFPSNIHRPVVGSVWKLNIHNSHKSDQRNGNKTERKKRKQSKGGQMSKFCSHDFSIRIQSNWAWMERWRECTVHARSCTFNTWFYYIIICFASPPQTISSTNEQHARGFDLIETMTTTTLPITSKTRTHAIRGEQTSNTRIINGSSKERLTKRSVCCADAAGCWVSASGCRVSIII